MNAEEGPVGGDAAKLHGATRGGVSDKDTPAADGDSNAPGSSSASGDEPLSERDALAQLRGESTSRQDVARSVEIIARRLRKLEESEVRVGNLYMFNAGVEVGGDLNAGVGTGSARRRSGPEPIDPAHIADYTAAYVAPDGFADALAVLRARHLLVLSASPGTGRDAAMFALLDEVLADGAQVCRVRDTVIAGDGWSVSLPSTGYVVLDVSGATTALLDDAWLTRVGEQLRAEDSYLILVTASVTGKLAAATRRADYVVETLAPPDPVTVVRARVIHMGAIADEDVEAMFAKWGVGDVLAERPRPRFAVQVAMAIVDALVDGRDVVAAINRLSDPADQVREWFADHEEPAQIAFVVATAVLEESSYLTVSDGAVDLFEALAPEQDSPPPLRYRRRMPIEQPWIELARDPVEGSTGPPVVRFRSPQLQPVVLDFAWNELDGMRPALHAWLRRMVAHDDVEVRARAATAAGMLARQDFQYALHRFILPWASGRSFVVRHSAAIALSVVGAAAEHTERVWTLLRHWTSDVHLAAGKRLASTAGTVAGGPLGVDDPRRALKVLRDLIDEDDWVLLEPVALSVFQLTDGGRSAEVLETLLDWTDEQDLSQAVVKGLTAFLFTVREQAIASAGEEPGAPEWPALLTESTTHRAALSELWGRGLSCRPVRGLALEALREWVRTADRDARALAPLLDLLGEVADRGDRDFERLHFHLDRWAEDPDDPSPVAGELRDALSEPS